MWDSLKASLDIQQYKPAQAAGIITKEQTDASGRHFMLKNPQARTYARLSPEEFWIWQRLDGEHTVQQLVLDYFTEFKSFAFGAIVGMLEHLRASDMLMERPGHLYEDVSAAIGKQGWLQKITWLGQTVLTKEFIIKGLNNHLDQIHRRGGWLLFTWPVQVVFFVVSVVGLYFFVRLSGDPSRHLLAWDAAVQLGLLSYVPIVIHEFGHAITAKHVGCDVHRGGMMLYYGLPAAFVETTDVWMFGKRERLMVTWGGPYTGYIIGGACSIIVFFFVGLPAAVADALLRIAFIGILETSLNVLPVLKLDGYYLLSDALEIPRLRERSMDFLAHQLPAKARHGGRWTRDEVIFLVFGLLAVVSTVFFAYGGVKFWDEQTSTSISQLLNLQSGLLPRIGAAVMALVGLSIIIYSLALLVRAARRAIAVARRRGLLSSSGRSSLALVVAALALSLLPALALPMLASWILLLVGCAAFAFAAWLALLNFRDMRGSNHAGMWLAAIPAYILGALAFVAGMTAPSAGASFAIGAAGVTVSLIALLLAGRLLRGLWGSWRTLSLALALLGIATWAAGLVTGTTVQTLAALLILAGALHWRMRPHSELSTYVEGKVESTRARMSAGVHLLRSTLLDELALDFGSKTRMWVEGGAYTAKKKDIGTAEFAKTIAGMTPDDYGGAMALALEVLLSGVRRAGGAPFARRALARGFDRLNWELQEITEDHVLKFVPEAQGLSSALVKTREDVSQLIRSIPLFAGMSPMELQAITAEFKSQVFERGAAITRAGDEHRAFYVVRIGRAVVLDADGRTINQLSRGDYFGEASLLTNAKVQSTLQALTAVEVLRLGEYEFDRLVRASASFDAQSAETLGRVGLLRRIPLFAQFDGRDLLRLSGKMEQEELPEGQVVFQQGEAGDSFYVVRSGKVSVQIDAVERATLGPGEYFGEIALLMNAPRTATVVALQATALLRMQAADFRAMLQDSSAVQQAMERASSGRVLSNERWMRETQAATTA
jgi:CRP-like cAMP-binding protein